MNDITQRFIEVYEYLLRIKKIKSNSDFCEIIGMSTSMMTEITKGRSNVGVKYIQNTVLKFPTLSLDYIILGEGKMNEFKIDELNYDAKEEGLIKMHGIPLIPIEAIGGIGSETEYSINFSEIEDRYIVPLFDGKGVDFLTSIRGNSMYPKYSSGDVVACKFIKEWLFFQWGRVYVIDTKSQGPLIKRILQTDNSDYITCRSDNDNYPDFNIPLEDIRSISLVIGVIRLE